MRAGAAASPASHPRLGCVIADMRHDQVQTVNLMLDGLDAGALDTRMAEAGAEAHPLSRHRAVPVERIDVLYELDMHYLGQTHTVAVPLPVTLKDGRTGISEAIVRAEFEKSYSASFSRLLPGIGVRIVWLRTAAIGRRPAFDLTAFRPDADASLEKADRGTRKIYFAGQWHDARVWSRLDLPVDAIIAAPAILEQPDTTTFIEPGLRGRVDAPAMLFWSAHDPRTAAGRSAKRLPASGRRYGAPARNPTPSRRCRPS